MVYGGRPSRGCLNCKRSHAKCDEISPACSLCVRRKLVCPGYKDDFDLVFRDQTEVLQNKAVAAKRPRNKNVLSSKIDLDFDDWAKAVVARPTSIRCLPGIDVIPGALKVTPEEVALASWFEKFILLYRNQESRRGYLEYLLPMYTSARHDSPLALATSALAMIIFSGPPSHRPILDMALKVLGDTLALTRKALEDPVESKNDQTLMTILLLSMAEGLLAMSSKRAPSDAHAKGAIALLKHRGKDNFKSDNSKRLFVAVQTQMVGRAVQESMPVERLPDEWAEDIKLLPANAATRLTDLEVEVASLLASAKSTLDSSGPISHDKVEELSNIASEVDRKLTDWAAKVPKEWVPVRAKDNSPAALARFEAYGTTVDIYPDIWVVSIWNSYRNLHIAVLQIVSCCSSYEKPVMLPEYARLGQLLVDDICATIPFCLGSRVRHEPDSEIEYPCAPGSYVTNDHRKAARTLGAWFSLGSLNAALGVKGIPKEQQGWILKQLLRIKGFFNLDTQPSSLVRTSLSGHRDIIAPSKRSYHLTRISQPDAQLMIPQYNLSKSLSRQVSSSPVQLVDMISDTLYTE